MRILEALKHRQSWVKHSVTLEQNKYVKIIIEINLIYFTFYIRKCEFFYNLQIYIQNIIFLHTLFFFLRKIKADNFLKLF
jgi:hypothetical protein